LQLVPLPELWDQLGFLVTKILGDNSHFIYLFIYYLLIKDKNSLSFPRRGMFVQPFYFVSYYFSWIEYDDFYFYFQETYNSRLREKYGDDPSIHPNFDPDLWMEVGSFSGLDKNQVYGLSNTTVGNLQATCSVLIVGSSQSVSNTQSKEFMALKQQYAQLSVDYQHLHQMIMDIRSKMSDDTCAPPFWLFYPGNDQPPPPPPPPPAPPLF